MCWQFLWFLMVIKLFIISLSYVYLYFYLDSELNPCEYFYQKENTCIRPVSAGPISIVCTCIDFKDVIFSLGFF